MFWMFAILSKLMTNIFSLKLLLIFLINFTFEMNIILFARNVFLWYWTSTWYAFIRILQKFLFKNLFSLVSPTFITLHRFLLLCTFHETFNHAIPIFEQNCQLRYFPGDITFEFSEQTHTSKTGKAFVAYDL